MHTLLIPPLSRNSGTAKLRGRPATKSGNPPPEHLHRNEVVIMIAFAHICVVIGVILLVVGLLMMLMGRMGHAVGGRRHYY